MTLIGLNIAKFFIYSDYYSIKTDICKNPGLNDGFVCQGIAVSEENGVILVCGYMKDKSNSRIYVTDFESNSYYVELTRSGEKYTGHAGGLAITGDTVYIANAKKIYSFPLESVLSAKNGDIVDIGSGTKVNTNASFVYTDEEFLYRLKPIATAIASEDFMVNVSNSWTEFGCIRRESSRTTRMENYTTTWKWCMGSCHTLP